MAKQPSKSARADSSAGQSAAAVSSNTDAVAAAAPATPKAPDSPVDHAVADDTVLDKAALLAVIKDMAEDLPPMIAELEANARLSGVQVLRLLVLAFGAIFRPKALLS
jgi:hypothetical protein